MNFDEEDYKIVSKTVKKSFKLVLPKDEDLTLGDTFFLIFKRK